MTLYDNIYLFIYNNIFATRASVGTARYEALYGSSFAIGGVNLTLADWLTHTCTIAIMILAVILACLLVRWVWRVVSSAFLLK